MKFRIRKQVDVNHGGFDDEIETIWYCVEAKNPFLRFLNLFAPGSHIFSNLKEAREAKKLLEEGKFKYIKSNKIIE